MSWQSTIDRIVSVIAAVSGVENVYEAPLTETSRPAAEAARNVESGQAIQSWEIIAAPVPQHHGVDGYLETEAEIEYVAHWKHAKDVGGGVPSLRAFRAAIQAVNSALLDPASGLPQIKDSVISPVETPEKPVSLPTGQSAWRARYRFTLWDTSST